MTIFTRAIDIYKKYGYEIRTGLNPFQFNGLSPLDIPFTMMRKINSNDFCVTGGGISPVEIYLFETLSKVYLPNNIYIVGNAFGWSTVIMALSFPKSKIVAIDSGLGGVDSKLGIDLTYEIAKNEGFDCCVEYGVSPDDTKQIIDLHFGEEKLDLVFIDGYHSNEQQLKDYQGIKIRCNKECVFLFHDVINYKMEESFAQIKSLLPNYNSFILWRTTSGMGVCIP